MVGGAISGISQNRFPEKKKYNNLDDGSCITVQSYNIMSVTNNMVVVKFSWRGILMIIENRNVSWNEILYVVRT